MKDLVNKWYKNHAFLYKILLFISTTILIVYLFPKSGKFKYDFDKGKPWQSENLYAPFDFAIKKSAEELEKEQLEVSENSPVYFEIDLAVKPQVYKAYDDKFKTAFTDSVLKANPELKNVGIAALDKIYAVGLLDENYDYVAYKEVIILEDQTQKTRTEFSKLTAFDGFKKFIGTELRSKNDLRFKTAFVSMFFDIVKPNLAINKSLTQSSIKEKLDAISLVRGSVEKGTLLISKGEIVEGNKYDVLKSLEAEYESQVWSASDYNLVIFAYALLVALVLLMLLLFLRKYRIEVFMDNTKVTFIFFNILLMILLTTLIVNYNAQYVYVIPLCILPLVLKAFFDARLGLFAHVLTILLLGFIVPKSNEYIFLQIIAGIVTILTVSELYKRANLFISVGQITLIYIISYFAFYVIHEGSLDNIDFTTFGLFVICGLATLFVQPLIYIYEKLFGLVSDVSLLELSDTNTKLLKELSNKAPGTFHHSLNVANLAEASANEIGANAMLIRVGALYHDIGKMKNPTFFTENQATGLNPHDELAPRESAKIIIDHVINGIETAKKNNLPDRVIDFIRTHHGTSLVYYFYMKEKGMDEDTTEDDFRYPGPQPFSKETAILMMCDSVEAASKSLKDPTSSKIDKFVETIIAKQMEDGQFLNANITFKEIQIIKKVLKSKLANIFHLRIEYPE
ncbi:HDIG domain-containing protein [Subsaximicrobium wynnwilliamsii]|uniref:HDIG domain-containing protein n=1 Tax=Subsaximicrobium wynnwilliamsii TaxID=291179 RepID=A0A5C6ZQV6_9FLAO|nr:HDIG domain-containing metalloprotein [Subsaximicrobium wynnwilliamsii]TXD85230.1 HDIG domain-containing protein [Subsaximicrobium wynnwilliamsii]TXD91273.1 HDIG domain-containing protein [Subsaximicrobium wynnwilliamsii]TXE04666.1 HDIG domain-containing protein [Subsaximicrobium wynnwilliamsii]